MKIKPTLLLLAALFSSHSNQAQDLIVTKKDSLNAQINKIKNGMIYFDYMKNGEFRNTLISTDDVVYYQKNFYAVSEISKDQKRKKTNPGKQFQLGLEIGYAYRLGDEPEGLDPVVEKYLKDLKSGVHWALTGYYLFHETIGLGLELNSFYSSNSATNIRRTFEDGSMENGIKNDIHIKLIGPSVLSRFTSGNHRNSLNSSLTIGYMSYKNDEQVGQRFLTSKGSTAGVKSNIEYNLGLNEHVLLAAQLSAIFGSVNTLEISEKGGTTTTIDLEDQFGERENSYLMLVFLSDCVFYFDPLR